MKDKPFLVGFTIGVIIVVSPLFIKYVTIPLYKHIITKPEIVKPLPARSQMIKNGTGLKPAILDKSEPKETVYRGNLLSDTLTGRETVYLYPNVDENKTGQLQIIIMSDSLSGCTNGTVYFDRNRYNTGWFEDKILTINGSTNQQLMINNDVAYEKVRLRIVGGFGTQSTEIRATAYFKKD